MKKDGDNRRRLGTALGIDVHATSNWRGVKCTIQEVERREVVKDSVMLYHRCNSCQPGSALEANIRNL